ncbi:unnamed protein product [Nezara viridula]|uniref:Uncharacterized protein n=1 Tax=Nezara viridula TaxID=85310 RepID=A0A9P0HTY3_NEZVI|nr:unnamed protein product [Nezara viridula]
MCNTNETEDFYHFLAACPILSEFRIKWLKSRNLSRDQVIYLINGNNLQRI